MNDVLIRYMAESADQLSLQILKFSFHLAEFRNIPFDKNKCGLNEALCSLGFSQSSSEIIAQDPNRILWKGVVDYVLLQVEPVRNRVLWLLGFLQVNGDPGPHLDTLSNILCQRPLVEAKLCTLGPIPLTVKELVDVLQKLFKFSVADVVRFLDNDPLLWLNLSS